VWRSQGNSRGNASDFLPDTTIWFEGWQLRRGTGNGRRGLPALWYFSLRADAISTLVRKPDCELTVEAHTHDGSSRQGSLFAAGQKIGH
jgi:hypothetical protein